MEPETADMVSRVIVSVEQFTSFRGFTWCPLGSLHKRLRAFDRGMSFQRSVEFLIENGAAEVKEYSNPQSEFLTKGISLTVTAPICQLTLQNRDRFVRLLLTLYERNMVISENSLRTIDPANTWDYPLWFSIMGTENILNEVPGRGGQYSLFRTHHTVSLVADAAQQTIVIPGQSGAAGSAKVDSVVSENGTSAADTPAPVVDEDSGPPETAAPEKKPRRRTPRSKPPVEGA